MRQESGGQEQVVSSAGAMGLMQVMPDTYAGLQERYGLGSDPFEPRDNILAGTAYIREMYDRYGAPGFLAAYNAGPNRVDNYLGGGNPLPDETVQYVAAIAPRIGGSTPMTGPLAVYAGINPGVQYAAVPATPAVASPAPTPSAGAAICNPDAAYDPDRPCMPPTVAVATAAPPPVPAQTRSVVYSPNVTYASAPTQSIAVAPAVITNTTLPTSAGTWAIQVGAFLNPELARAAAENARLQVPSLLSAAHPEFPTTEPFGSTRLYRARLANLSPAAASDACSQLVRLQQACLVVPPGHS
jgi:hypothetical protein